MSAAPHGYAGSASTLDSTHRYLDLLKRTLLNTIYRDRSFASFKVQPDGKRLPGGGLGGQALEFDVEARETGVDWPTVAHTMVGRHRLDNLHECLDRVLAEEIPGDVIETGAWRGGVCIFMRGFFAAHGRTDRTVWVADSFEGLPAPERIDGPVAGRFDLAAVNDTVLSVSLEEVQENFRRYDLLDDQVRFLPGWFADTLPKAPIDRLSVLRMDGDWYGSTMDALVNLYPKLSPGGFVIVDDYRMIEGCRRAVDEFRAEHGIVDEIREIDGSGVFWRRG
ncbi:TylF/MycF family methyltransferase [Amycolatopsis sp. OK19-0408]|uniref:TylF/MycF family methyltransferase n=1 Tax=Amycolatopsis iheyensis TaxID=2945988 RepID=A0A9X2NJQ3_9PSEU|nr:TylF/MycF family methyltransferase [Amycolatopsis iheyensis]MCR6488781.1 TylF/MycF family methyltransferase [Amycolatopsis iheyensis]